MDFDSFNSRLSVSRETFEKFKLYHNLLLEWQQSINLISRQSIDNAWERHIMDCAQWQSLFAYIKLPVYDLGCGAGLPGIILSIGGIAPIKLVESDQKKVVFLKEAKRLLNLSLDILPHRIEEVKCTMPSLLTSRALAPLDTLLSLCFHLLCKDSVCLFAKGKNYAKELEDASMNWNFTCKIHPSKIHSESIMLELTNVTRR